MPPTYAGSASEAVEESPEPDSPLEEDEGDDVEERARQRRQGSPALRPETATARADVCQAQRHKVFAGKCGETMWTLPNL